MLTPRFELAEFPQNARIGLLVMILGIVIGAYLAIAI
jgi:hypothetical protein